jgi:GntR family transcriptional regulator/MocR family aminotransferase
VKRTTSAAELLVRLERRSAVPLRLQLERDLRLAVQSGRLVSWAPLPSTRALAADLGLSRGVVVEAFDQLLAEGCLTSQHGSATRVAARRTPADSAVVPQAVTPSPRFDLRPGLPDLSLFPRRAWLLSMRRALAAAPNATRRVGPRSSLCMAKSSSMSFALLLSFAHTAADLH